MKAKELKQKYLDFFKKKGHVIIPSASLIPTNDPSVLFNTAGMQPLVPYLLGQKHPLGNRLANVQKCLRTVDFDNIGDNTHHTFFQMLGNWGLGDYFKKESIAWSFEFLTSKKWLNLSLTKLAFTVYKGDDSVPKDEESAKLWLSLGVSKERIAYLGKDNFWSAGETGPCGPSTEIFYWAGDSEAPKKFDAADNNWVEIWNNVFMTYNRQEDGTLQLLKQKNADTGMGLERTLAVLSGKKSAYETDLFLPIIKEIEKLSGKKYEQNQKVMRIIADHLRASVFILGDDNSVIPSNVDRGYILRRLLRKAIRLGRLIGIGGCFTTQIGDLIIANYKEPYPELQQNRTKILTELEKEEHKFNATLENGLKEFEKIAKHLLELNRKSIGPIIEINKKRQESFEPIKKLNKKMREFNQKMQEVAKPFNEFNKKMISAREAFLLFQSYGFPIEMTEELAAEKGVKVDKQGFKKEYEQHQELSRVGAEKKFKGGLSDASGETGKLHTATHLLNEALRKILKEDIKQKGSNITPERLRFDFNFDRKLTPEEIKKIENEVNRVIKSAVEVKREELPLEKALSSGAHGEFGTKYPPKVSVYTIGDYSKEICMGPHANNTSELGKFKIVKEESSASGVRRIKAVLEK